jgi:hypothetical protein
VIDLFGLVRRQVAAISKVGYEHGIEVERNQRE